MRAALGGPSTPQLPALPALAPTRRDGAPAPALPACSPGQEVSIYDGRPNGELLLATGEMEAGNPAGAAQWAGGACAAAAARASIWALSVLACPP